METCTDCFEAAMKYGGDVVSETSLDEFRHWRPRHVWVGQTKKRASTVIPSIFCKLDKLPIPTGEVVKRRGNRHYAEMMG